MIDTILETVPRFIYYYFNFRVLLQQLSKTLEEKKKAVNQT